MSISSQDLYPSHPQVPSNLIWIQCSSCSACYCIVLNQPPPEGFWRPEETKEHLSHFPTSLSVDQRSEWDCSFWLSPEWFICPRSPSQQELSGQHCLCVPAEAQYQRRDKITLSALKKCCRKHSIYLDVFYLRAGYFPPQQSGTPNWQPLVICKFR